MASSTTAKRPHRAAEESTAFGPIAERFRRAGDLDRAVSLCREGLQKFPNQISARVTLGWALLDQGKFDDARVELEKVMRRAPDNLAAIRGLAELHDRAEHTMNLPMDGPGAWPPEVEDTAEIAREAAADTFEDVVAPAAAFAYEPEISTAVSQDALAEVVRFTAAHQDDDAELKVEAAREGVAVFTNSAGAAIVADAAPTEVAVETEPEVEEFFAEAPVAEHAAVAESDLVSEADIAALIAEAEKLEAAATANENETAAIDVVADQPVEFAGDEAGNIELEAAEADDQDVAAEWAATAELIATVEEPMVEEPVAEEPVVEEPVVEEPAAEEPVEIHAVAEVAEVVEEIPEPVAQMEAEAVAEVAADAVAEPIAEEVLQAEATAEAVIEAEATAEAVIEAEAEVVTEPLRVAAAVAEPVIEAEAVAAAPIEVEAVAEVEEDLVEVAAAEAVAEEPVEIAVVATPVAVDVEAAAETIAAAAFKAVEWPAAPIVAGTRIDTPFVAATLVDVVHRTHLAEIIPLARAARAESGGNTLVALERLLVKVQARKREVMTQSVA